MAFLRYSFALALLSGLAFSFRIEPNCKELTKPLQLDGDYSSIMGKWTAAVGASEGIVGMIIQTMETHWIELSPGANDKIMRVKQAYRLDNTCRHDTMELPLSSANIPEHPNGGSIQYYLLPSCSNCLIGYLDQADKYYHSRVLMLFSREREVSTSTVDLFKKQAECLGFPELFTFYNKVSELCPE
ncbi:saxitoxin and tetrodotoxin-binding protein 2-like [Clarias magur]|uniref:Saxitoxin and tetrodotoxin-binding protein 2-like n=1 Tax=Clarias magur TaxID=1594786 RepID=A0A8J4X0P4_CLAMG|nr:saxitoxin and tetrodotoxin-binding protein 2-like [Clarias magur]